MVGHFINFLKDKELGDKSSRFLLAISGGVDSVVMADLFSRSGHSFAIAHANFQLRGEESERDEQFVRNLAESCKVDFFVKHFDTLKYAGKKKVSVQVAARELRYQWFDELLMEEGYDLLATAHHQDDQVETFLINLTRGTGIAGLHGIPVKQGRIIRPLMFTCRKEIEAYARERSLDFVEDSSNRSLKYTRNRIRHKIIPELEKINPSFRQGILETISNLQDAEIIYRKAIDKVRGSLLESHGNAVYVSIDKLDRLEPIGSYAYELFSPFGFNLSQVNDIIGLKNSLAGKEIVSPTHRLVKDREFLIIVPRHDITSASVYEITPGDVLNGIREPLPLAFEILDKLPEDLKTPPNVALIDFEKLVFPLILRKWKKGDSFIPFGMSNPKKLSDFFTDLKYSAIDKENQWLLCSGKDIVWIVGKRIDNRYKVTPQTLKILKTREYP